MTVSLNDFQGNEFGLAIINMRFPVRHVKTNKNQLVKKKKASEIMP